ncbi:MAG: hypothetical protein P8171_10065 [Candidatus Thiodiazotropha sp.]
MAATDNTNQPRYLLAKIFFWLGSFAVTSIISLTPAVFVYASEDNFDVAGSMSIAARVYTQNPSYSEQNASDLISVYLQPELRYEGTTGRYTFVPFYRFDSIDDERTHFDIRELNWRNFSDQWDILIGIDRVFWGVTESRHLVDIINQTDLVDNIDEESKLGQPMIRFNLISELGNTTLFLLPGFRERTFPGSKGRLRAPHTVSTGDVEYESDKKSSHLDWALRYSLVINDWDIGVSYFSGTSREPRLITNDSESVLIPFYDQINQLGIDAQLTSESWLWKFEGINRYEQDRSFFAGVLGLEYTLYQIADSDKDLGLLGELLYDNRDENAPPTLFDRDIFFGLRLNMNDVDASEILVGLIYDNEKRQHIFKLEAKTRLSQRLSVALEAWQFHDSQSNRLDYSQDDYIQLQLNWHL